MIKIIGNNGLKTQINKENQHSESFMFAKLDKIQQTPIIVVRKKKKKTENECRKCLELKEELTTNITVNII